MTGNETTLALANVWAETRLANQHYVSLGGFGGYIIVGFDHSISKRDGQYDFAVMDFPTTSGMNCAEARQATRQPVRTMP